MMGLGYWSNGGSSSSASNLSALAPPFTVDRSNPKPNSNPLVNFNEPPYGVPYSSSLHSWQYSHSSASRPNFFSNPDSEVDAIRTSCVPSVNDYPYSVPQSVNSSNTHWAPSNPSAKSERDALSYIGYSDDIPTGLLESTQYYPPYVSPVVQDDNPLVSLNEPSYDLLSTSHVVPFLGHSQVDYTQSLSGLEYAPKWGGVWNGLADGGERSKGRELDGIFRSEEMNVAGSNVYKNYMKKGAHVSESLSKCEVDSAFSHGKPINAPGRENHTVSSSAAQMDEKSYLVQNSRFITAESSRATILEPHPSSLEPGRISWNHQKPYNPSLEKSFQPFDYCMNNYVSVTRSSPALVIKPPASETMNLIGNSAAANSEGCNAHNTSKRKEPYLPLSSEDQERCFDTNQLSFHMDRNDPIFVPSSSLNAQDGSILTVDSDKAINSTDSLSDGLDHHNPAVDSPCWKGAPASPFSSFEASKAATPQHLMKTLEASYGSNPERIQILSPYTDDSVRVSFQKLYESSVCLENGCTENDLLLSPNRSLNAICAAKDHGSDDEVASRLSCMKLSSIDVLHSCNDIDKPRTKYDQPHDSKSDADLKSSEPKHLNLSECDFTSKLNLKLRSGSAGTEMNTNDASADGCVPLRAVKHVSCLPSGQDTSKLAKVHVRESAPKMNAQMLTNAIHNLSELLLFHCSNDPRALSAQDHEVLNHAITNLDTCMLKKQIPQKGISLKLGEIPNLGEGASAGRTKVMREAASNAHGQLDYNCMREEKWNGSASGKKVDKFWNILSLMDDAEIVRDDKMVQDIKKVLTENFHVEEDEQSQTLLYKNLWLEAEAALCSLGCRARFDRMKIEMEKCNSQKEKDVSEDTSALEKLPSSEVSPDPNATHKLTPETEDCPIPDATTQNYPTSSTTTHVDDVEASVMARFHILKSRGENSNSVSKESKQVQEADDARFEGKRHHWPFIGDQSDVGSFDMALGPHMQLHDGSYMDSPHLEDVKEFRVCVSDNPITQSHRYNRLGNQLPLSLGLNDGSSSDWEHVLKEDILWQN